LRNKFGFDLKIKIGLKKILPIANLSRGCHAVMNSIPGAMSFSFARSYFKVQRTLKNPIGN